MNFRRVLANEKLEGNEATQSRMMAELWYVLAAAVVLLLAMIRLGARRVRSEVELVSRDCETGI